MGSPLERVEGATAPWLFVHSLDRASERALVLAHQHDIVCVADEVEPSYLSYLGELGLGPAPERVIAMSRFSDRAPGRALWARLAESTDALRMVGSLMREGGPSRLHPSMASRGPFALAAALEIASDTEVRVAGGDPAIVEHANQKHEMRERAIALGIPVAEGEVVQLEVAGGRRRRDYDVLSRAVERRLGRTGRVIVRGSVGAGGSATIIVGRGGTDVDGIVRALSVRAENRTYLVEVMSAVVVSSNVQLYLPPAGGAITCVGVTDQRWERPLVQSGNLYPSAAHLTDSMLQWSFRLAGWLQGEGYAGLLGLDFVEYADPATGIPRAFLADVNPRVGADTYPLALFARLNAAQRRAGRPESRAFVSGTIGTRPRRFAEFRRATDHHFYSTVTGSGVVPHHVESLGRGRCGVVVFGPTRDAVLRAYGELQSWCRREA